MVESINYPWHESTVPGERPIDKPELPKDGYEITMLAENGNDGGWAAQSRAIPAFRGIQRRNRPASVGRIGIPSLSRISPWGSASDC